MNGRLSRRRDSERRRATAVVEMALITPLLMLILMGIIEFGWLFHVKSSLTTASRLGARTGTLPGATVQEVQADVDTLMAALGFAGSRYSYTVDITMADADSPYVTVEVSMMYTNVSLVGSFFSWLPIERLASVTVLRHEVVGSGGA